MRRGGRYNARFRFAPAIRDARLRSGGVRRYDGDRLDLERFDIKRLDDAALASIELDADGHTPVRRGSAAADHDA